MEISYWQAWALWRAGETVTEYEMLGLQILWWGRAGKIVGFASALFVIGELVGRERLAEYGTNLKRAVSFLGAASFAKNTLYSLAYLFAPGKSLERRAEARIDDERPRNILAWVYLVVLIIAYAVVVYNNWPEADSFWTRVQVLIGAAIAAFLIAGLAATLVLLPSLLVLSAVVALLEHSLVRPVAWALRHQRVYDILRVASVALLGIGFHFDLLAS